LYKVHCTGFALENLPSYTVDNLITNVYHIFHLHYICLIYIFSIPYRDTSLILGSHSHRSNFFIFPYPPPLTSPPLHNPLPLPNLHFSKQKKRPVLKLISKIFLLNFLFFKFQFYINLT
jgi:hypothetical protein